jgi:hypothetical protein
MSGQIKHIFEQGRHGVRRALEARGADSARFKMPFVRAGSETGAPRLLRDYQMHSIFGNVWSTANLPRLRMPSHVAIFKRLVTG